jgi:uncharacterized OsmC-like protein
LIGEAAAPDRAAYGPSVDDFTVRVAAGSLKRAVRADASFPHRWSASGVSVEAAFTGAHLLHLSAGGCVLNDIYREAERLGLDIDGVLVSVDGDFDRDTWVSTGITYSVEVDSPALDADVERLLRAVEAVAEIPRALRAGATVERRG